MNSYIDLGAVLDEAYENYGLTDDVGISYFSQLKSSLAGQDFKTLLGHLMMQYPSRYVLDFILGSPWLWLSLPAADWVAVLESETTRIDSSRCNSTIGNFADIEFMSRYIGVDALAYIIDSPNISLQSKNNILAHFAKFPYALAPSVLDEDDLDGQYFVSITSLISLKEKLCKECGIIPIDCTDENANSYIDNIRRRLVIQ